MHHNILKYANRPFANLGEMHDALVQYHNELVKPNDHVSFLGDVTIKRGGRLDKEWFTNEIRRYNGHKRLYLGNHDHWPAGFYLSAGFEKVYATWRAEEGFVCSHIPLHPRSLSTATANVHGHTHQTPDYEPVTFTGKEVEHDKQSARMVPYINVCVEVTNYRPIHVDQILERIEAVNRR